MWVDAICINQDDTHERSLKIEHMLRIYSEASVVIACAGPYDGSRGRCAEIGLDSIERVAEDVAVTGNPNSVHDVGTSSTAHPSAEFDKSEVQQLGFFFKEIYWERVWIIQELTVNPEVVVLYANREFRW